MCDDQIEVGNFVRRIAEGLGYEVEFTDQPDEFGRLYRSFDPDVVVLDLAMPAVDGIELLHVLAEEHSRALIVLMSGLDPDMRAAALRLGRAYQLDMAGIIAKPIRSAELRDVLEALKEAARLTGRGDPVGSGKEMCRARGDRDW